MKNLIDEKIQKILKIARDRVMVQYNEIKNAIKKFILLSFGEYEKKINSKINLCFGDKEDSYKKLTKKISQTQKELVFL